MVDDSADKPEIDASDMAEVVEKSSKVSIVWIFPIAAALLGAWLLYRSIAEAGIPITLTFETASGLEAGKTMIKFKDVQIGLVDTIEVSEDMQHVVLNATVDRTAERYLHETTRFWVVRPRITTEGISGLSTLLSGAHITLDPGSGVNSRAFTGLETAPIVNIGTAGQRYVLHAQDLGSVGVGSPIYYRGIRVGEVLSYAMEGVGATISMEIFVDAPHHDLVRQDTQFWNVSGIDVRVDADGMSIQTASLTALLIGGIAFETQSLSANSVRAEEGRVFELYRRHEDIDLGYTRHWAYVVYFNESVRGLSKGAPVEVRGLKLGEVSDIGFEFDADTQAYRVPVTLAIEPERLLAYGDIPDVLSNTQEQFDEIWEHLIANGLRAQLKTGSLLTGQLFVDLVTMPGSPEVYAGGDSPLFEMPAAPTTGLARIEESLTEVLARIRDLPLERLINNAADAAESIDSLASNPQLTDAIYNSNQTLEDFDQLAKDASFQLERLGTSIQQTLSPTSTMGLGAGLANAIGEFARTARSIRILATYLERHPEALIQGKPGGR